MQKMRSGNYCGLFVMNERQKAVRGFEKCIFYEVFGKCDLEVVVHEFLKLAVDSPDINVTEEVFRGAIKILNEMEPEKSDTEILCIEKIQESGWIDDKCLSP